MSLLGKLINYDDPSSIGFKLRSKRIKGFLSLVNDLYIRNGKVEIIDIGGTRAYWKILPMDFLDLNNVTIYLLNMPGTNITSKEERFKYIEGDGCDLSGYKSNSFDIVHSNSVIEHVGDWGEMLKFSKEIRRLAKCYYIQTPNYWFPIEPHCVTPFFHWLPKPFRVALIMRFSLGNWARRNSVSEAVLAVESAKLLDYKMFKELFYDAELSREKVMFLSKSLIAIKKN